MSATRGRRFVLRRKVGATIVVLALALVTGLVITSQTHATSVDTCGYNPASAPKPGGGTVMFDENSVTRAIAFYGTGTAGHVGVFTNDESGLLIGAGGTSSSSAGSTIGTGAMAGRGSGSALKFFGGASGRISAPARWTKR